MFLSWCTAKILIYVDIKKVIILTIVKCSIFFCYNVSIPGFWEIWHSAVRVLNGNIQVAAQSFWTEKQQKEKTNKSWTSADCLCFSANHHNCIIHVSSKAGIRIFFFHLSRRWQFRPSPHGDKNDLFPFAPFSVTTTPYQNVVFVHRKNHSKHCGVYVSRKVALQPLM